MTTRDRYVLIPTKKMALAGRFSVVAILWLMPSCSGPPESFHVAPSCDAATTILVRQEGKAWAEATGHELRETSSTADIQVSCDVIGEHERAGETSFEAGEIRIYPRAVADGLGFELGKPASSSQIKQSLLEVVGHELGHALGLGHVFGPQRALMNPDWDFIPWDGRPTELDLTLWQERW